MHEIVLADLPDVQTVLSYSFVSVLALRGVFWLIVVLIKLAQVWDAVLSFDSEN